jgi:hypothetical protein
MANWLWASASRRGTSHERSGTRLQDAYSTFTISSGNDEYFVALVADGAGSSNYGGEGASLVCRSVGKAVRRHFRQNNSLPEETLINSWIDETRDLIYANAKRRDTSPREFASTLLLSISNGRDSLFAHVGDGCIILRDTAEHRWIAPIWPDHGEYASTTNFVTDVPEPALKVVYWKEPLDSLVLFTDGLERLALDFREQKPYPPFFQSICSPLFSCGEIGRNIALSGALREFLNSTAINERTDDDKTLVLAIIK